MADSVLLEVAKSIPAVVGLIIIVYFFLQHISEDAKRRSDDVQRKMTSDESYIRALKDIGSACHDFQNNLTGRQEALSAKVVAALERNTEALGRNSEVMGRTSAALEQLGIGQPNKTHRTT